MHVEESTIAHTYMLAHHLCRIYVAYCKHTLQLFTLMVTSLSLYSHSKRSSNANIFLMRCCCCCCCFSSRLSIVNLVFVSFASNRIHLQPFALESEKKKIADHIILRTPCILITHKCMCTIPFQV